MERADGKIDLGRVAGFEDYWAMQIGQEKSKKLYFIIEKELLELIKIGDYRNNESVKEHMTHNIFPRVACYRGLQQLGYEKDEALKLMEDFMEMTAEKVLSQRYIKMSKVPFIYLFFKLMVKPMMNKSFPAEGWKTEWVTINSKEIAFNLHSCLYCETLESCGCPELGPFFCKNDDISFSKLAPKIIFQRSNTIANGGSCCDFKFVKEIR